jgi:hypothetical protein
MNNIEHIKGASKEDTTSDIFTLTELKCTEKLLGDLNKPSAWAFKYCSCELLVVIFFICLFNFSSKIIYFHNF